jgi:hypothetical protein
MRSRRVGPAHENFLSPLHAVSGSEGVMAAMSLRGGGHRGDDGDGAGAVRVVAGTLPPYRISADGGGGTHGSMLGLGFAGEQRHR